MAVLGKLWRVYVFDLAEGKLLGELEDVRDLRMTYSLSKNPTLGFTTGYGHHLTDELVGYPGTDTYRGLLAYRWEPASEDYVLRFAGPVLATDEQANQGIDGLVSVSAVGAGWRLTKRIADNDAGAGRTNAGLTFVKTDRAQIAAGLISTTNTKDGNSWIRAAEEDQATSSMIAITREEPMQSVAQLIDKLSNSLDGFDWVIDPVFTTDGTGLVLGRFRSAPNLGSDKTGSVRFDYGVGRFNVETVARKRTIETMANTVSFPAVDQRPFLISHNAPEMIAQLGVFEEVISGGDILDPTLRRKLVKLHTAIRRRARLLYEFVPVRSDLGPVPVPFTDYDLGDRVATRAAWGGRVRLEAGMRIYGFDIEVGNDGVERVKLDLYLQ